MERIALVLIPFSLAVILVRLLITPAKLICKLLAHSGCGFLCLWMLNLVAPFTGILLPVNPVTVSIAGFLGVPGIGIVALLAVL